jgi:hypothetical protein
MGWIPETLRPEPEPWFVAELKKIDKDLRIVFGYERYFVKQWALERKMTPERYHAAYKSILESGEDRFVDRPIFDSTKPIFDEYGDIVTYEQIGVQRFDLAPEWEWVSFSQRLDEDFLTRIRRSYAWERNHPISRVKFEMEQERLQKENERRKLHREIIKEGIEEAFLATRKKVQFGFGKTRSENNEV